MCLGELLVLWARVLLLLPTCIVSPGPLVRALVGSLATGASESVLPVPAVSRSHPVVSLLHAASVPEVVLLAATVHSAVHPTVFGS